MYIYTTKHCYMVRGTYTSFIIDTYNRNKQNTMYITHKTKNTYNI